MSYDFYGQDLPKSETHELEQGIYSLGIRPELLADLSVDDARFVLGGIAKLFSTITHPDHGVSKTILGQDASDINAIGSALRSTDDTTISQAIEQLKMTTLSATEHASRQELNNINDRLRQRNTDLARHLLAPRGEIATYSGRVAISILSPVSRTEIPDNEVLDLVFENGIITDSTLIPGESRLASSLSKTAQAFVHSQRPDLDSDPQLIFIDTKTANKSRLPKYSWCHLLTAKGVQDPAKKKAAVRIFNPAGSETSIRQELVGCRIFGTYAAPNPDIDLDSQVWPSLELPSKLHLSALTSPILALSDDQLTSLLANGFAEPANQLEDTIKADYLILRKDQVSSRAMNYLIPRPWANIA